MPAVLTPDAAGFCWTDWSPCTVSCVPQGAAYFARQFRKQISCESLANYSLVTELALISSNATIQENVSASFKPCDYKLPICQQAPQFPSVQFNNLVYMRALVLSLASLFVLIPTLIVCIKYRRHAHPFVWLHKHAASLRDLTERSDLKSVKSVKQLDLKTLTPGVSASTIQSNGALISKTSTTTTESKSKEGKKDKPIKRNTEWSKVGSSVFDQETFTPPEYFPGESVGAPEVFTTVNIEPPAKNVVPATPNNNNNIGKDNNNNNNIGNTTNSVETQGKDERTQESKTNDGSEDVVQGRKTKSLDNQPEINSVTGAQNDVAPQVVGPLVKGDVGAKMEEKSDSGGKKEATKKKSEETTTTVKVEETQAATPQEGTPLGGTPKEG